MPNNQLSQNNHDVDHAKRNQDHTYFIILSMASLMFVCAWFLFGMMGIVLAAITTLLYFLLAPRISGNVVMNMYRAKRLNPEHGRELYDILEVLSERAELKTVPEFYIIPSATLNAFATGTQEKPYIGVTESLIRQLELQEIAGIIAHEISHIRNNDLKLMSFADTMSRITQLMSFIGLFLIILNVPLMVFGEETFPWFGALLLYIAPAIGNLLQLALSRVREFDADYDAAMLSGDPIGLAAALFKVERYQGAFWEDVFFPGRRIPQPSLLRTHPPTEERIERLRMLKPQNAQLTYPASPVITIVGFGPSVLHPRYHWPWPGIWY
ncbi:MAG: M48 family metalloprotease [Pseudomonadota bacterium]